MSSLRPLSDAEVAELLRAEGVGAVRLLARRYSAGIRFGVLSGPGYRATLGKLLLVLERERRGRDGA